MWLVTLLSIIVISTIWVACVFKVLVLAYSYFCFLLWLPKCLLVYKIVLFMKLQECLWQKMKLAHLLPPYSEMIQ